MSEDPITLLVRAAGSGDDRAFERLFELSYDELRRLAHAVRRDRSSDTIDTTGLVHEAYLKLVPSNGLLVRDRIHFFRIAARAMRQVLVDAARRRGTRRRALEVLGSEGATNDAFRRSADVLALDAALTDLEAVNARQASVVECRFFGGLTVEETAEALEISTPTVKRDWRVARAFLAHTLGPAVGSA